jgi:AbrB family looped-hinge helix DNA binding protein
MTEVQVRLGENGRVVIPAAFRRRLGLKPGDPLILRLDDERVMIESRRAAVRAAQRMIRELVPEGELLTERLFEMRRAENKRD